MNKEPPYFIRLRKGLEKSFDLDEVKELCFDLGINHENLPGGTKKAKIRELILSLMREGRLHDLLTLLREKRANVNWPEIPPLDQQDKDAKQIDLSLPTSEQIRAHLNALAKIYSKFGNLEYRSWSEGYIPGECKKLPLYVSRYDNLDTERANLLSTIDSHERLLVLGEAGTGKTVAMQRLVWETAQGNELIVPIYIHLRSFEGNLIENARIDLKKTGELDLKLETVRDFLHNNSCLFILDGLDEVPENKQHDIVPAIENFVNEFQRHRYVVTCRSHEQLWGELQEKGIFQEAVVIQRITDEQVRKYLIARLGEERGKAIYSRLDIRLRRLAHTPLFLRMIEKVVEEETGELPSNRGELFAAFVRKILEHERKRRTSIPVGVKKQSLSKLAYSLQESGRASCARDDVHTLLRDAGLGYKPKQILKELLAHGLLVEEGGIRFLHLSIQEHFAAVQMHRILQAKKHISPWMLVPKWFKGDEITTWATDKSDRWTESFVQLAGLSDDPSWLVRELLHVKPWLAFWCYVEGKPIDPETMRLVEIKTRMRLGSSDARARRTAYSELGRYKNERILPWLINALADKSDEVVEEAEDRLVDFGEEAVKPLISALNSDQESIRLGATRVLGRLWGIPEVELLGSPYSWPKRQDAIEALLKHINDLRVLQVLIVALKDSESQVRRNAVKALGLSKNMIVVDALISALADESWWIRHDVVRALGRFGDARAVKAIITALNDEDDDDDEQGSVSDTAVESLINLGEPAVNPLVQALEQNKDWRIRCKAAQILGSLNNQQATMPLIKALEEDVDSRVRGKAAEALGKLGDERAVELLIASLDKDKPICDEAVQALGQLGDPRAVEPVINALMSTNSLTFQNRTIEALGVLGDARAVKPLIRCLRDDWLSHLASEALAKIGVSTIPYLIEALDHDDFWTDSYAANVANTLGSFGEPAVQPLLSTLKTERKGSYVGILWALELLKGAQINALLIDALTDEDWRVRYYVAFALGNRDAKQAVAPLITSLKDESWQVRRVAAQSLGRLNDPIAVLPLIEAMNDGNWQVQRQAAWSLGRIDNIGTARLLLDILEVDDEQRNYWAAVALGTSGDVRAVKYLIEALKIERWELRYAAVWTLGSLRDTRAIAPLYSLLETAIDDTDLWPVIASLGKLGDSRVVEQLIDYVRDENWGRRKESIEVLGDLGDRRAVIPITGLLKDERTDVRQQVVLALIKLGDPRAIEPLIERGLQDESPKILQQVIQALGDLNDKGAVQPLINLLNAVKGGGTSELSTEIIRALGKLGEPQAIAPLIEILAGWNGKLGQEAVSALVKIGEPATEPLLKALYSEEVWGKEINSYAVQALGRLGDLRAVEPLITILGDHRDHILGNHRDHKEVIEALGRLGDARAVHSLVAILHTWDEEVHQEAVSALVRIGEPAVEPLINILNIEEEFARLHDAVRKKKSLFIPNKHERERLGAVKVLGQIRDLRAVESIINLLAYLTYPTHLSVNPGRKALAIEAIRALGDIGDTRAIDPLITVFAEWDSDVHQEAVKALSKLGKPAVEPLITALKDENEQIRAGAARALGRIRDSRAAEPLAEIIENKHDDIFVSAVISLGRLDDQRAVAPLITFTRAEDPELRWKAIVTLGELGDERAFDSLMDIVQDENEYIRIAATWALGKLGNNRAINRIAVNLQDDNQQVRVRVAWALGQLGGDDVVEPLIASLEDEDTQVRWTAAYSLGEIGSKRIIEPLLNTLNDPDERVRAAVVWSLGAMEDVAVIEPVIYALRDSSESVRGTAAEALGKLRDPSSVESLIAVLNDNSASVTRRVVTALGKIGDDRAVEPLIRILAGDSSNLRWEAVRALVSIGKPAIEPLTKLLLSTRASTRRSADVALAKIRAKAY